VTELAGALRLDKSNASRITASLVAKGYLLRAASPGDRRAFRVSATRAGRELERRIKQEVVARQQAALARFSSAVRSALPDALNALALSVVRPSERK
jgi:DNA-binding MarR family transcriptional regulator